MSKETLTFRELIELIDSSVKSGKIKTDYPDFLKACRDLGISSYILNTIIIRAKKGNEYDDAQGNVDDSFFVPIKTTQDVSSLQEQNQEANEEIAKLQEENANLVRKEKMYGFVILFAIILGCGVGWFFLNNNLNSTKSELKQANQTISNKNDKISELKSSIDNINKELEQEKIRYSNLESEIASVAPIVITRVEIGSTYKGGGIETSFGSTLYRSRARFLTPKVYYRGFSSGSYTIKMKWYMPDGKWYKSDGSLVTGDSFPYGYTQSSSYYFSKGSNDIQLGGWGYESAGNWDTGTYKLEIWCNDKCIYVKIFTIYS